MLKKSITYEDFNGDEVTEDYFFHLSRAELVELEVGHEGGLSASLQKIVDAQDGKAIIAEFKNIILGSYGQKSSDGRRFVKNQQLREEFESSEAYSVLFMDLVTNADAAAEFVNGIVPQGMVEEAAKVTSISEAPSLEEPKKEKRIITPAEVERMSTEEFAEMKVQINSGLAMIKKD